jgi:predicted phosphoribosyltransferase/dienelactone hydrolase
MGFMTKSGAVVPVSIAPHRLEGLLGVPRNAKGLVIFAHGSGSGRLSPRNNQVADGLRNVGLATLVLDLLRPEEEADRANVFDIVLLAERLISAMRWARGQPKIAHLGVGFFGASTGAGAALLAASELKQEVRAVVSRGGRPDLAGDAALQEVRAPTLLIVGGEDTPVIALNRKAFAQLHCTKDLVIVPGATHLFEEPGTLEQVTNLARVWFLQFLPKHLEGNGFSDREEAGRELAAALAHLKDEKPIVLALPRGGVPVAYEVAKALGAPLDVILVRKIGAPGHKELGIGAVVDGANPQLVLNEEVVRMVRPSERYILDEGKRELAEIERRRELYRRDRPPLPVKDRTVVVVDDGIATGGTMKAVLKALRESGPKKLVLAVPVAPADTIAELSPLADEVVALETPEPFFAVGAHYRDFAQTTDDEVMELLSRAAEERAPS